MVPKTVFVVILRDKSDDKVKKPSIAIVAGASTSEDVCPWESGPPEPISRKIRVSWIQEALRLISAWLLLRLLKKFNALACSRNNIPWTAAVDSFQPTLMIPPQGIGVGPHRTPMADSSKRKVSSFEDNSSVTTSTSSSVFVIPSDTDKDNKPEEKTLKLSKRVTVLQKTFSVAATSTAPTISVSSATDDLPCASCDCGHGEFEEEEKVVEEEETTTTGSNREPLAPLAEPDSESPASEFPPSETGEAVEGEGEGEAKSNDVCPWEDE
ncbi:hypothetical protein NQ317_002482 [Molorchus minor]|uniref:Uncharacterized protein n=1 Tax=Molorchus minor TaxID=1323400 RepID=A0ABQ9IRA8_9CUCU|nr:hypothetical protein NQ317_002482 [Molorchus minor]